MIKAILFDFDDTLSDFPLAKERAKEKITPYLRADGIAVKGYWDHYESLFETLFARYIDHELTVEEYRLGRFLHHGVSEEKARLYNEIYLNTVSKAILFDDVLPCLKRLKQEGYTLAVLTNGPESQRKKIEECAAGKYFDRIFISAEMGVGKPHKAAYDYVLHALDLTPDEVVMVGDNTENDCLAAEQAGIRAVQIDRSNHIHPHYRHCITTLLDFIIA